MFQLFLMFDENTNQKLSFYTEQVENRLHQNYLRKNHIPFHLTMATYKTIDENKFIKKADDLFNNYYNQELYFVSIGCFQKSMLYLLPVYNDFLNQLIMDIHQQLKQYGCISKNNRYLPYHFVPHVSLIRKMNEEQINIAFSLLNHYFEPFYSKVTHVVLAQTRPYKEIKRWSL